MQYSISGFEGEVTSFCGDARSFCYYDISGQHHEVITAELCYYMTGYLYMPRYVEA